MTLIANGYVLVIEMADQFSCLHGLYRAFLICATQQGMDQLRIFLPDTACKKSGRPYPCEAGRKDVHQEPTDEFI